MKGLKSVLFSTVPLALLYGGEYLGNSYYSNVAIFLYWFLLFVALFLVWLVDGSELFTNRHSSLLAKALFFITLFSLAGFGYFITAFAYLAAKALLIGKREFYFTEQLTKPPTEAKTNERKF